MIQILTFPNTLRDKFKRIAVDTGGDEVCAVLVGCSSNLTGTVEEVRLTKNIAPDKAAGFMMAPVEFLDAILDTDLFSAEHTTQFIGIIHSHYFDRPYPSIADWYGAVDGRLYHGIYIIYSIHYEQFHCYYWNGNEFIKTELLP